jgi:hypothetical protein
MDLPPTKLNPNFVKVYARRATVFQLFLRVNTQEEPKKLFLTLYIITQILFLPILKPSYSMGFNYLSGIYNKGNIHVLFSIL